MSVFKNIIYISLILILLFLLSNDQRFNHIINLKKMNYFLLLICIYFVYTDISLLFIILLLLILLCLNKDFSKKYIYGNAYLRKMKINEYFEDYDIKPFETKQNEEAEREIENEVEREEISKEEVQKGEMKQEEPFKEKVREIREKFDDILNKK